MKKFIFILMSCCLFLTIDVNASTTVETRTRDDLKIRTSIVVTEYNIDNILETPKVDEKEKVYDFADLLTDVEEKKIYDDVMSFIEETNYDLAVVTISDNNKYDTETYADDFYDYNYFGFDDSYSGLLMIIDMDNRIVYISTTGLAIKMYDDKRIDDIIDAGYVFLKNEMYGDCIDNMIYQSSRYYSRGFPSSNDNLVIDETDAYYEIKNMTVPRKIGVSMIVAAIVTLIVSLIMYFKTRLKIKVGSTESYLINERDLKFNARYVRSSVSRVPRNIDGSGGGGFSSGGGSSIHTGSSGSSHGGGGRGF